MSGDSSSSKSSGMSLPSIFEISKKSTSSKTTASAHQSDKPKSGSSVSLFIPRHPEYADWQKLARAKKLYEKAQSEAKRAQEHLSKTEKDFEMMEASVRLARENRNKAEDEQVNAEKKAMVAAMTEQETLIRKESAKSQVEKAKRNLEEMKKTVKEQELKLKEIEKSLEPKTSILTYSQRKLEQDRKALISDSEKELDEVREISEKLRQSEINKCKANNMARHMVMLQGNNMIASLDSSHSEQCVPNLILGLWDHKKIFKSADVEIMMANRFFEPYFIMKKFISPFNVFRISFDERRSVCTFVDGATHIVKKKDISIPIERMIERLFISGHISCINCSEDIGTTNGKVVFVNFSSKDPDSKNILLNNGSFVSLSSIIKNIRSIEILVSGSDLRIKSIEDLEAFFMK